jgi:hypothetical protein
VVIPLDDKPKGDKAMNYRRTPKTTKPDPEVVQALIERLGLTVLLHFDERPRSLKFFKAYTYGTGVAMGGGGYSISRSEAREIMLGSCNAENGVTFEDVERVI